MGLRHSMQPQSSKDRISSSTSPLMLWKSKSYVKSHSTLSCATAETTSYSLLPSSTEHKDQHDLDELDNTSLLELNPMQSDEEFVHDILANQTEDAVVAIFTSSNINSPVEEDAAWLIGWEVEVSGLGIGLIHQCVGADEVAVYYLLQLKCGQKYIIPILKEVYPQQQQEDMTLLEPTIVVHRNSEKPRNYHQYNDDNASIQSTNMRLLYKIC